MNFWYAGCAPCRAEAPDLEAIATATAQDGVQFVGVNVRDTAPGAQSFLNAYGITYPNVIDGDGAVQLAFASSIAPNAVPTTIVLDSQGRIASGVLGTIVPSTLSSLISTAVQG